MANTLDQTPPRSLNNADLLALEPRDVYPVRFIDTIQPHGILLSLRYPDLEILQLSANAEEFLQQPLTELIGHPLTVVFAESDVEWLRHCLDQPQTSAYRVLTHPATAQRFTVGVHRQPDMLLLELELQAMNEAGVDDLLGQIQTVIAAFSTASDLRSLVEIFARETQRLTEFDRVMVYRFKPNLSGVVVAEANTSDRESYLGLHYPATDIPREARELFYKNSLRFIPDLNYVPVPLVPATNPLANAPLDLGSVGLRGVSPPHIDYLQRMGVGGSMSLSLTDEQGLWGLIACHHYQPKPLSTMTRMAFTMLAKVASLEITRHQERDRSYSQDQNKALLGQLGIAINETEDAVLKTLTANAQVLLNMFEAEGAALVLDQDYALVGRTPAEADIKTFVDWLFHQEPDQIFATQCLAEVYPPNRDWSENPAGVLGISIF